MLNIRAQNKKDINVLRAVLTTLDGIQGTRSRREYITGMVKEYPRLARYLRAAWDPAKVYRARPKKVRAMKHKVDLSTEEHLLHILESLHLRRITKDEGEELWYISTKKMDADQQKVADYVLGKRLEEITGITIKTINRILRDCGKKEIPVPEIEEPAVRGISFSVHEVSNDYVMGNLYLEGRRAAQVTMLRWAAERVVKELSGKGIPQIQIGPIKRTSQ